MLKIFNQIFENMLKYLHLFISFCFMPGQVCVWEGLGDQGRLSEAHEDLNYKMKQSRHMKTLSITILQCCSDFRFPLSIPHESSALLHFVGVQLAYIPTPHAHYCNGT